MHGCQVVEPARREERLVFAEHRAARGVGGDDVEPADRGRVDVGPGCGGELAENIGGCRVVERRDEPPDRLGLGLFVKGEVIVRLAVEVDRELRQPQQRARRGEHRRAVVEHQPAGEAQFTVEPRVQQRPAVDLDAGLQPAGAPGRGLGLELEGGRVAVRAEDVERRLGGRRARHDPGDDGAVAHHELSRSRLDRPRRGLVEGCEPGVRQPARHFGGGVEARRRGGDEVGEVVGVGEGCSGGGHPSSVVRRPVGTARRSARPYAGAHERPTDHDGPRRAGCGGARSRRCRRVPGASPPDDVAGDGVGGRRRAGRLGGRAGAGCARARLAVAGRGGPRCHCRRARRLHPRGRALLPGAARRRTHPERRAPTRAGAPP